MAGPSDALEKRRDPVRRSDLTGQIDVADIDAELERRGGDERFQLSRLEPRFRVEPLFLRQAAVVRRDRILADAIAQVTREALGHPPRVDEHQRRAMRRDQLGQAVVVLLPHLVRHHRFERRPRDFQAEIDLAAMALRRQSGNRPRPELSTPLVPDQKPRDFLNRLLRRGQADAKQRSGDAPAGAAPG